jgi:acetoacetyl-CoA synthase
MEPLSIGILGTGSYVPEQIQTNAELEASLHLQENWICSKTGIVERRIAASHEATSDLATHAAVRALSDAHIEAAQLDLLIIATSTPDHPLPATASIVQTNIGADHAAAFDVSAVCSGFIYALVLAQSAMQGNGLFRTALVIGADTYSRILDYQDHRTCVLFGDGAGAVVLGRVPHGSGIRAGYLRSDGSGASLIQVPAGGSRLPVSEEQLIKREHFFHMNGRATRAFIHKACSDTVHALLTHSHLSPQDIDLVIPHQANGVILHECMGELGIAPSQVCFTLEKYGNTAAASVPITLDVVNKAGKISDQATVLLLAFGGGLTWGGVLLRWVTAARICNPLEMLHGRS